MHYMDIRDRDTGRYNTAWVNFSMHDPLEIALSTNMSMSEILQNRLSRYNALVVRESAELSWPVDLENGGEVIQVAFETQEDYLMFILEWA